MELTSEEHEWAVGIKEVIEEEGTSNLDSPPSDYWCAQLALVDKDNVASAMDRLVHMQHFRQECDIRDTVAQGRKVVQNFVGLWPAFCLSLSRHDDDHSCTLAFDLTKFHTCVLRQKSPKAHQTWFQAIYCINHAMCSDLEATRTGFVLLLECDGFDRQKNFGLDVLRNHWSNIAGVHPINHQQIRCYHTGLWINMLASMAKKFMPAAARDQFKVGCVCGMGGLSNLYLTPSLKAANQRFLDCFLDGLQKRYANEATFRL